jgi:hypothetical protein
MSLPSPVTIRTPGSRSGNHVTGVAAGPLDFLPR